MIIRRQCLIYKFKGSSHKQMLFNVGLKMQNYMQLHHFALNKTNVFGDIIIYKTVKRASNFSEEQIVICGRSFSEEADTFLQIQDTSNSQTKIEN